MADTFSFPDYNMPGFPYANLPAQLAALFVPPNLQFTNGSQYGRWNGVNANAFGLFPNQFQPLFAPPVTPSSVFQPPWGNNGYIGSNQGPGSNPGGLPPPSLPGGQPPQSGSPPPTNPPPSSQPSGFPPIPPGGSLYGNGPMVPPAGSQGGLLPPYLPPMTGVPPAGYGSSPPPPGSSSLPPPPSGTIAPPMANQQKMAMASPTSSSPSAPSAADYAAALSGGPADIQKNMYALRASQQPQGPSLQEFEQTFNSLPSDIEKYVYWNSLPSQGKYDPYTSTIPGFGQWVNSMEYNTLANGVPVNQYKWDPAANAIRGYNGVVMNPTLSYATVNGQPFGG